MELISKIYTPPKNPKEALILITVIVLAGILGQIFLHDLFMIIALIFWMQYTAVLSYKQFKKKIKRPKRTLTEILLLPQLRFFLFMFIAIVGIISTLRKEYIFGHISLIVWWLFSLNFYLHYKEFKKD